MINSAALGKVEAHITDAVTKGASVATGGSRHALGGTYFEPTILTGVMKDMQVASEEMFGTVAPLFNFDSIEDVIAQTDDTKFGLVSYFYAKDPAQVWRVVEALEYGIVGAIAEEATRRSRSDCVFRECYQ